MNSFIAFCCIAVFIVFGVRSAEENKKVEESTVSILGDKNQKKPPFKRLIPADVLRDFPGMCFASTRCATIERGQTWDLTPFCGQSTCVVNEENPNQLLELVEDCGPLPTNKDKCKLDVEKFNKTAPFPHCCPIFKCEDGVTLEYPDIKSPEAKPI